jgi:hypothetical protein
MKERKKLTFTLINNMNDEVAKRLLTVTERARDRERAIYFKASSHVPQAYMYSLLYCNCTE